MRVFTVDNRCKADSGKNGLQFSDVTSDNGLSSGMLQAVSQYKAVIIDRLIQKVTKWKRNQISDT